MYIHQLSGENWYQLQNFCYLISRNEDQKPTCHLSTAPTKVSTQSRSFQYISNNIRYNPRPLCERSGQNACAVKVFIAPSTCKNIVNWCSPHNLSWQTLFHGLDHRALTLAVTGCGDNVDKLSIYSMLLWTCSCNNSVMLVLFFQSSSVLPVPQNTFELWMTLATCYLRDRASVQLGVIRLD